MNQPTETNGKQSLQLEDIFDSFPGFIVEDNGAYQIKKTDIKDIPYSLKISGADDSRTLSFWKESKDEKVVNLPISILEFRYIRHSINKHRTVFPIIPTGILNSKEGPKYSFELLNHINESLPGREKITLLTPVSVEKESNFREANQNAFLF